MVSVLAQVSDLLLTRDTFRTQAVFSGVYHHRNTMAALFLRHRATPDPSRVDIPATHAYCQGLVYHHADRRCLLAASIRAYCGHDTYLCWRCSTFSSARFMLVSDRVQVSGLLSSQHFNRVLTIFRTATVSLIYNQSLKLGDASGGSTDAVTVMSADVDRTSYCLHSLNEIW